MKYKIGDVVFADVCIDKNLKTTILGYAGNEYVVEYSRGWDYEKTDDFYIKVPKKFRHLKMWLIKESSIKFVYRKPYEI